jgi:hypothetical protein
MLKKKFKRYGELYDSVLFNYITSIRYPTEEEWNQLNEITQLMNITIYRATDYFNLEDLKIGNVIYFDRFTSWTDKFKVSEDLKRESDYNIIFKIKDCNYSTIDLRRINYIQKEILVAPIKTMIVDIIDSIYSLNVIDSIGQPNKLD